MHLLSVYRGPTHLSTSMIHERVLSLTSTVNTRRTKHACSRRILAIGARHLSLLCGAAICRTLSMNEILTCAFENITRLRGADSTIFAFFSQLFRPFHLLSAFVSIFSCIDAPFLRQSACRIHLFLFCLVFCVC